MGYATAHLIGSRQFHAQEQQRRLIENQDDHERRMLVIVDEANALNARYEVLLSAFERVQRHQSVVVIAGAFFGGVIAACGVFFVVMRLLGR